MFAEDAADHDVKAGANVLAMGPISGYVIEDNPALCQGQALDVGDQLVGQLSHLRQPDPRTEYTSYADR